MVEFVWHRSIARPRKPPVIHKDLIDISYTSRVIADYVADIFFQKISTQSNSHHIPQIYTQNLRMFTALFYARQHNFVIARIGYRMSVRRVYHRKTVEVRIMKFSPYGSPVALVFAG